ncbi:MAG TPA: glycosyltransferase family 87 protein [Terracidiphilus sp.]|nr:glycosyltransferase family 87 protein [Terracidiphilus sp.]
MRGKLLRILAVLCLLGIAVWVLDSSAKGMSGAAGGRDFIAYWAAGQQLVHGASPYDGPAILKLEATAGLTGNRPAFMLNLPIAFFLAWPLGFVSSSLGMILWTLAIVASLMVSVRMLWILLGRPEGRLHLLAYLFAPVLACLMAGQLGTFMLLGVVAFLYFHETRPWLAGAALLLCAIKPHLFLAFGVVIVAWALWQRAYQVLAGISVALAASFGFSVLVDRQSWSQYSAMMRSTEKVLQEFIPTWSVMLRVLIDRNAVWLQFMPMIAGAIWGLWFFWSRRNRWNWMEHGLLLLIVSEMCSAYAWFTDEVVLLPAILAALYRAEENGRSLWVFAILTGAALAEVMTQVQIITPFYLWTVPAWLGWYLYATRNSGPKTVSASEGAPSRVG